MRDVHSFDYTAPDQLLLQLLYPSRQKPFTTQLIKSPQSWLAGFFWPESQEQVPQTGSTESHDENDEMLQGDGGHIDFSPKD